MKSTNVYISDIIDSQRIDVAYFSNSIGEKDYVALSKYVTIKGGKRIPKGRTFSSEQTDYLYLRLSEISDFERIDFEVFKCIDEDLFDILKRYEIHNNQIVFSIAGTIGKVFVLKDIPNGKRVILTENCAMIQPKDDSILPDYISILLNSNVVQKQIGQNRVQTTIPKIGLDRIAKLKVPKVPPIAVQQKIVEIYSRAQQTRLDKLQEAKDLLNSIDDYLLEVLKIDKKQQRKEEHRRIQKNVSSIIGSRFDVSFHKGIENIIEEIKKIPNKTLGEISEFSSNSWDQKSLFEDRFPYIEISSIDTTTGEIINVENIPLSNPPSRAKKIVQKNDILVSMTRPNRGAICIYNGTNISIASTGFSIIRRVKDCVLKEYLHVVLRSSVSLKQMELRSSGGNYPAIIESELKRIIIPIPPLSIQQMIVDKICVIKNKSKQLQKEGDALLEEAKQRIEKMIIG